MIDRTAELAAQARADLQLLSYPSTPWVERMHAADGTTVHAVVVVGAGQSGLAIAASLRREGVDDVLVLDRQPQGYEGVWDTFARMRELRTPKGLNGMDFGCPSLSVQRWFDARFGEGAWERIDRIPRTAWMDYLRWYRATLDLAVENDTEVADIRPANGVVAVDTRHAGRVATRLARTVVIASGYAGAGFWQVPAFISDGLPDDRYDHTNGPVDFERLRGRRIAVLGHAASALDNANTALACGAASVDLCFRRAKIPRVNPHRFVETAGTMTHFCTLPDAMRWRIARHFRLVDQPPPELALELACAHPKFRMHPGRPWQAVRLEGAEIVIATPKGELRADHLLLGTGATVELEARPELRSLAPAILRWRDRFSPAPDDEDARLGALPYVDEHYGFLPKVSADASGGTAWVARVFCFNAASHLSHGPHATSNSGHRHCLPRVVRGVTDRLFREQQNGYLAKLAAFDTIDLAIPDDFEAKLEALEAAGRILKAS
ncbi:MAG TPA: NAD(P)/FAD-dependent oxidoreductase [Xanthobacteraceae bacterium]|nr:NAD(P)/FAD-dependent oxidoreductase [Xanthobacteraceae bacterium]